MRLISSGFRKCGLAASSVTFAVIASIASAGPGGWDITDTGQPFTEAEFTVTEGTWMSVDVSPDGRTLVFDLLGDIYSMPASGGEARLIHGGPAVERMASFSPDGDRLLYLSDISGSENLWISSPDGSDRRRITEETVDMLTNPTWGPDGDYVAAAKSYAISRQTHMSEIRLFHLDGGAGRVLVEKPDNGRDVQEPVFSPDGRYVYYTHRLTDTYIFVDANHANYAIKRRDLATGETETILAGFGGAVTPQVSPDGKRIAFVRRVQDKTVLFVYDTETREQRPVYDDLDRDLQADFVPQGAYYPKFDWFPDNRHVAIWGKGKLYKINMDDGTAAEIPFRATSRHKITTVPRFSQDLAPENVTVRAIRYLAVAPDGETMLFNALGHVWRKELPNGEPQRLTDAENYEFEAAYAPDGRRVAYVEWNDERGGALKIASASGGNAKTLATSAGVIRHPAFSPDGKSLVYRVEGNHKDMGGYSAEPGIYWISRDGGESRKIVADGEAPRFSPDGQRIFYTREDRSSGQLLTKIESVNLDGFDRREHARAASADRTNLQISPDLNWIAFKEYHQYYVMPYHETGEPMVISADSDAVPVTRLTDESGYGLTWSADSRMLHWALGPDLYRVAVADLADIDGVPESYAGIGLEVPGDKPEGVLAFTNGRIITMQGDEVIENGTVVVEGNRILAVGPADEVSVPRDAKIIDVTGKTVMPGLVDMHGHIDCCYYGGLMPQKQASHYAALAFGVTTNYDPYTSELPAYIATEMQRAGVAVGPRVINVGKVIYGRAGKIDSTYVPISDYEDAQAVMARKKALGGTIIKSYKQTMRSQRQQLIKAGREAGIMVDVEGESHFYYDIGMILDGHVCLEHNLPLANYYDDLIQLMARSDTAHTPTLIVTFGEIMGENYMYQTTRAWDDPKVRTYVQQVTSYYSPIGKLYGAPPYVRGMTTLHAAEEIWDVGFRSVARSVRKLDDAGVLINVGSHGQIFGLAMHWEMWLMAEGGMDNHRILRAATLNGAKTLDLEEQIGSLEAGKLADLIVLDENPLEDIRNSNSVHYTLVNGRLYDSFSMNEIGNYDRPRRKFYWELPEYEGIDWSEAWAGQ